MSCEEEEKEGQAGKEQSEDDEAQDQVRDMPSPPFGRRRDLGLQESPDLREVWREPMGGTPSPLCPASWNADTLGHRMGLSGTPLDFRQEYLGKFPELTQAEIVAEGLWAQYHLACEEFDQVVCSGRRRGVAVPAEGSEYGMINRHALGRRRYLVDKARSIGISDDQLRVSAGVVNRELMSSWNYLVKETMMAMIQRMNDLLGHA